MSCSPFDLKDYFLNELGNTERDRVKEHLKQCRACREELDRLRLTQAALHALHEEEVPRRIAFVSDEVFEPRWWQRLWRSGPRLGFASAALLSAAILVHALVRPAPVAGPAGFDSAAFEARVSTEVAHRLQPAIASAVAESEARQTKKSLEAVAAVEKRLEFDRAADRAAFEQAFDLVLKKVNAYYASASFGGRP